MNATTINTEINRIEKELNLPAEANQKVFDGIRLAVNVIAEALPKMKSAGVPASKAMYEAPALFTNIVKKQWGGMHVEFHSEKGIGQVGINETFASLLTDIRDFVETELS